jgi:hypothetical protein
MPKRVMVIQVERKKLKIKFYESTNITDYCNEMLVIVYCYAIIPDAKLQLAIKKACCSHDQINITSNS